MFYLEQLLGKRGGGEKRDKTGWEGRTRRIVHTGCSERLRSKFEGGLVVVLVKIREKFITMMERNGILLPVCSV